jgi:hypothetical protein
MIKLPTVTLVCVDCLNYMSAINAIQKSIEKIQFGKVLFLSDKMFITKLFQNTTIEKIKSKVEYSYFMLNKLNDFIETDFCLVVQYDGYIINPHLWRDYFLNFDYIGAPWWYEDGWNVGNGGFSLRSKRLLEACQKEKFENCKIEDNTICRSNRKLLESKYNIKFAAESIAEVFSFEPNNLHPVFKNNTFGFHGIPGLIL